MPQLNPRTLLAELQSAYSNLHSYQDEGVVLISPDGEQDQQKVDFETLFLKPDWFRFKFSSSHPYQPLSHVVTTSICGRDDKSAYMWNKHYQDAPRVEEHEDIMMAVANATGISSGSAYTIAHLLLNSSSDWFSSLEDLSFLPDETVDAALCKTIRGRLADADIALTFFVDVETMTLRRLSSRFENFSSEETRLNIRLNEPIDQSKFSRPHSEI